MGCRAEQKELKGYIMGFRHGFIATIAFALSSVALAGIVYTDAYSQAAQAEASGYHALTEQFTSSDSVACADAALLTSSADAGMAGTVQR